MKFSPSSRWGNPLMIRPLWDLPPATPRFSGVESLKNTMNSPLHLFGRSPTETEVALSLSILIWLVLWTPLKNMSSSVGMISNPTKMGTCKKNGNQTTNQMENHGDILGFPARHRGTPKLAAWFLCPGKSINLNGWWRGGYPYDETEPPILEIYWRLYNLYQRRNYM